MNMLRVAGLGLLLAGAGCLDIEVKLREPHFPAAAAPPIAPVTADRVTAENARDMAQALWDEFDREEIENDRAIAK
jgi:hypothetical protein